MKKIKLLALVYSQEDIDKINNWIAINSESFELHAFSDRLQVPLQAALSHFCRLENTDGISIDGFLIDDHKHYDSIVLSQVNRLLERQDHALYSASAGMEAVAGSVNKRPVETLTFNSFEAARSFADSFEPVAVLARPEKKLAV